MMVSSEEGNVDTDAHRKGVHMTTGTEIGFMLNQQRTPRNASSHQKGKSITQGLPREQGWADISISSF